jgi:hypothetical protein
MKWLAAWFTVSCLVVSVWISLYGRLRAAQRWAADSGNWLAQSGPGLSIVSRSERLASNPFPSPPARLRVVYRKLSSLPSDVAEEAGLRFLPSLGYHCMQDRARRRRLAE